MGNYQSIRVAILDLYEGAANQGMRCIREILHQYSDSCHLELIVDEFDVRRNLEVPGTDYNIYISSGGPGSPLETEGCEWEKAYFSWLDQITAFNNDEGNTVKKHVFLICHSFQLVCREWKMATVSKRNSTAFGVFPVHLLEAGHNEPVFGGLPDPFYVVDSRDYQVTQPNLAAIQKRNGHILAIEKARPHVPFERAVMSMRFNDWMVGTQFHPEADALGMSLHLQTPEKKATVIENHGLQKWEAMIDHLNDPDKIMFTYAHVLPNFLNHALGKKELSF